MIDNRFVRLTGYAALAAAVGGCPPIVGEDFFDGFGLTIADVGDLNGDLVHELACGAPDGMGEDNIIYGEVRIYSGISGIRIRNWVGTSTHSRFGSAIAGVGDMNGDGFRDVLVGAPRHHGGDFLMRGRAVVHSGLDGSVVHEWLGQYEGSEFGLSVASAGDYDGDDVPDAMVAAWQEPGIWGVHVGKVYVYSGADGSELATFSGTFDGERLGTRVAFAGDVDGDEVGDLLMSTSPVDTGGGENAAPKAVVPSRVYVYLGGLGTLHATLFAEAIQDNFGAALAALGDVDGDSHADFAVGANHHDGPIGLRQGKVYLHSGFTGALLGAWTGNAVYQFFGNSVAAAGDVDYDGAGDLIVGAPWYGTGPAIQPGRAVLLSGATGATIWELRGKVARDGFGVTVSGFANASPGFDTVAIGSSDIDGPAGDVVGSVTVVTPFAFCGSCAPGRGGGAVDAGTVATNGALWLAPLVWTFAALRRRRPQRDR